MITNTAARPAIPPNILAVSIAKGVVIDLVNIVICQVCSISNTLNTLKAEIGANNPPIKMGMSTLNPKLFNTAN